MTTPIPDPVPLVLVCHPNDYASMTAAAAAAGMNADDFCKLAIHLTVSLQLIERRKH